MSPLISRTGLLDRTVNRRDVRLFLIATEDTYAAKQYFQILRDNGVVDTRRVHVKVLETPAEDTGSSPAHVLARLNEYEVDLKPMDERWIVLDTDRWREKMLAAVCREAVQRGYRLANSNPCFDAWLLLHLRPGPPPSPCKKCGDEIRERAGSFNKTRLKTERYTAESVEQAIEAARALDSSTTRWPAAPGSHVYRLIEALQLIP